MIIIQKSNELILQAVKAQPYRMVRAAKDAANGKDYVISRSEEDAPLLMLISKGEFDAKVAAVTNAPPVFKNLSFDMVSAGIRADEIYHLVLGLSNFPGNEKPNVDLDASGFEHKIVEEGADLLNVIENLTAAGGSVTASSPIASSASVSARKTGADLTVVSVDLATGIVVLNDGVSPVANGVVVELRYQTTGNMVVYLKDGKEKIVSVILSKAFNDYLVANA